MKKNTQTWRIRESLRGSGCALHSVAETIGKGSRVVGRFGTRLGNKVGETEGIQDESLNGANHLLLDLASGFSFLLSINSSLLRGRKAIGFCSRSGIHLWARGEPQQWRHDVSHR